MSSLRGRLLLGAVLWTLGLIAFSPLVVEYSDKVRHTLLALHAHGAIAVATAVGCMVVGFSVMRRGRCTERRPGLGCIARPRP